MGDGNGYYLFLAIFEKRIDVSQRAHKSSVVVDAALAVLIIVDVVVVGGVGLVAADEIAELCVFGGQRARVHIVLVVHKDIAVMRLLRIIVAETGNERKIVVVVADDVIDSAEGVGVDGLCAHRLAVQRPNEGLIGGVTERPPSVVANRIEEIAAALVTIGVVLELRQCARIA